MNDYPDWETECVNCRRESHFLDMYCWPGIWIFFSVLAFGAALLGLLLVLA